MKSIASLAVLILHNCIILDSGLLFGPPSIQGVQKTWPLWPWMFPNICAIYSFKVLMKLNKHLWVLFYTS